MTGKVRYSGIDVFRGTLIILMVLYHLLFDMISFGYLPQKFLYNPLLNSLQIIGASLFIMLSGYLATFSKKTIKNGVKILLAGLVISLATYVVNPDNFIVFGILHFIGIATIIYSIIGKFRINPLIPLSLFFIFRFILKRNFNIPYLWILGITTSSFTSADYFPIFPWIFAYYVGVSLSYTLPQKVWFKKFLELKCKPIEFFGKYSLVIYLIHQPLLLSIFNLLG